MKNYQNPPESMRKSEIRDLLKQSINKVYPICNEVMAERRNLDYDTVKCEKTLRQGEYLEVLKRFDAVLILKQFELPDCEKKAS